jgi:hypothetical protein
MWRAGLPAALLAVSSALLTTGVQGFIVPGGLVRHASKVASPARVVSMSAVKGQELEQLVVQPIERFQGEIELPGSKSLSNRILLLSALAEGTTVVDNLLQSEVSLLRALGPFCFTMHHENTPTRACISSSAIRPKWEARAGWVGQV